jgi:hypothetical protein
MSVEIFLKYFKFCIVILKDCHTRCQTVENFLYQHRMYFFENIGWNLVYEGDAYSLY